MTKNIIFAITLAFCTINTHSQVSPHFKENFDFDLDENKKVFLSVNINGKDIKLFFDTGASISLLDINVARALGIKSDSTIIIEGAGGSSSYEIVLNQNIRVGQTEINNATFSLDDLTRLRQRMSKDFYGIIGYDILKSYITELNFTKQKFFLYPFGEDLDLNGYQTIGFSFDNGINIPQFDMHITQNNQVYSGSILFDSGNAGTALLVNTPFDQAHNLSAKAPKKITKTSDNLSKTSLNTAFYVDELKLGNYILKDIPILAAADVSGISALEGYMGLLGAPVINKFDWIIDYDKKVLHFKPNYLFEKDFDKELFGFQYRKDSAGSLVITHVDASSPFYELGMREGDIVMEVNGFGQNEEMDKLLTSLNEGDLLEMKIKKETMDSSFKTTSTAETIRLDSENNILWVKQKLKDLLK